MQTAEENVIFPQVQFAVLHPFIACHSMVNRKATHHQF